MCRNTERFHCFGFHFSKRYCSVCDCIRTNCIPQTSAYLVLMYRSNRNFKISPVNPWAFKFFNFQVVKFSTPVSTNAHNKLLLVFADICNEVKFPTLTHPRDGFGCQIPTSSGKGEEQMPGICLRFFFFWGGRGAHFTSFHLYYSESG